MKIIEHIGDLQDDHCDHCKIHKEIRKKFTTRTAQRYCNELCPVGLELQRSGRVLEFGKDIQVGINFTQEDYEKLSRTMPDWEVAEKVGIHPTTLAKRKASWGLGKKKGEMLLDGYTIEEHRKYRGTGLNNSEIAKLKGVHHTTLKRWIKRVGYTEPTKLEVLLTKYTKKDYMEARSRLKDDSAVGKEWGCGVKIIMQFKKQMGVNWNG